MNYEVNQAFDFAAFLSLFAFLLFDAFSMHKTVWCHAVLSLMRLQQIWHLFFLFDWFFKTSFSDLVKLSYDCVICP